MNPLVLFDTTAAQNTAATLESGAEAAAQGGDMMSMLISVVPMLLVLVGLYFVMIRPQNKKRKKEESMKKSAEVGDEITTIGGISGRIIAVKDDINSVVIETGSDRSRLQVKRWAIGSVDTVHEDD